MLVKRQYLVREVEKFKRFLSRKFLLTVLACILSVVFALSGSAGDIGTLCSVIAAFITPITYIITEGKIDAKALEGISESAKAASEILNTKGGSR